MPKLHYRVAYEAYNTAIASLRKLLSKYTFRRRWLLLQEFALRIVLLCIILTIILHYLITRVDPWIIGEIILPFVAWVLIERWVQPTLERRLLTPRKRNILKKLINEFYNTNMIARCQFILVKAILNEHQG